MVAERRAKLLCGDGDLPFVTAALVNSFSAQTAAHQLPRRLPESPEAAVSLLPAIKTPAGATLRPPRRTLLSALPTAPII